MIDKKVRANKLLNFQQCLMSDVLYPRKANVWSEESLEGMMGEGMEVAFTPNHTHI